MAHPWPLFDLRLRTPRLELRLATDEDIVALLGVAREGVHDPALMPFMIPWTDVPSPEFERSFFRYHWRHRATWTPGDWHLPLAVLAEGRHVGVQEIRAEGFSVYRAVGTGSWLGQRHHGRGIGTEMRAAVLHLAFEGLGAERATSAAVEGNVASARISEKLGYVPNGDELVAPRGKPLREQRYLLERAAWRPGRYEVQIEALDASLEMFGVAPAAPPGG